MKTWFVWWYERCGERGPYVVRLCCDLDAATLRPRWTAAHPGDTPVTGDDAETALARLRARLTARGYVIQREDAAPWEE